MSCVRRPDSALDRWFAAEILPHEAALTRYLRRVWLNPADIADLRQDIYLRVYEAAAHSLPQQPRPFLCATARNLLFDRIRHSRIVSIDYTQDLDDLNVLVDEISPERQLGARQELRRLALAYGRLSERSREAIWLRRIEGLSQREAAERLGLLETTLAGYLSRGLRALAESMFAEEGSSWREDGARSQTEAEHGN